MSNYCSQAHLQTTFMNQKLMNNYTFAYLRGKVRAIHRNLSTIKTLTDALISVGYKLTGSPFSNNYSLQVALTVAQMPHIQIFDLKMYLILLLLPVQNLKIPTLLSMLIHLQRLLLVVVKIKNVYYI